MTDDALTTFGAPDALVFDDEPLESLLGGDNRNLPTPAGVLDLWQQGIDRSGSCARALVSVLVKNYDDIDRISDLDGVEQRLRCALNEKSKNEDKYFAACLGALGRVFELKKQPAEAENNYRRALDILQTHPNGDSAAAWSVGMRLINLLEASDRKEEAIHLRNRLDAYNFLEKEDELSLLHLRITAVHMFQAGQFDEAEAIYHCLVEKRFELGSTHCHLARIHLITDRDDQAFQDVERAWHDRHQSPYYVNARVNFLKALLQMLAGGDWKPHLSAVKGILAQSGDHMEWTIQPALDHLKPRLTQENYELMTSAAAAMSDKEKVQAVESNLLWKDLDVPDEYRAVELNESENPDPVQPDTQAQ